jgi:hypothetical protein
MDGKILTREQILEAARRKVEKVDAFGGTVCIRRLTAIEFIDLQAKVNADRDRAYVWWLVWCVCDPKGSQVLTPDDAEALAGASIADVERVLVEAYRMNGIDQEEQEKNSKARSSGSRKRSR